MNFDLTEEQQLLKDSVTRLIADRYGFESRKGFQASSEGWSRELWRQYAEIGLLGVPFSEADGGFGGGPVETMLVMEAFGRALVLEPFLATVVLGGQLVAAAGTPEQKAAILPGVAAGETLLGLAATEPQSRWSLTHIAATASPAGDGWTISGEKLGVLGGDVADHLVVTARTPDGVVALFLVDAADVVRSTYRMQDGLGAADVLLASTPAQALGGTAEALGHLESVLDTATAMLCCEAVGAMDRMLWLTVDYLKTRVQFGQPISVFQALQFRAADMFVALEQARSMALVARLSLADDHVLARRRSVQAAKIQVDTSARLVGQEAIQLHGGIGMTMEYPVGHFVKRTTVIAKTFADTDALIESVGAGGGLIHER